MNPQEDAKRESLSIRDLYADLDEKQASEAEEFLNGYLDLALEIYEAICRDPERYQRFRFLTEIREASTMEESGSQPENNPTLSP